MSHMAQVSFTSALSRHVECAACKVQGNTVREVLDEVFADNPRLRGYVVDEQGACRQHIVIFVDGQAVRDRVHFSDAVAADAEVYVFQALSGG
jgi:molybdopterin synthase sulfur carrier subunit